MVHDKEDLKELGDVQSGLVYNQCCLLLDCQFTVDRGLAHWPPTLYFCYFFLSLVIFIF